MSANPERGEIEVDIEGVPHVLRPSYEALQAIEAQTSRSIIELGMAAESGAMTLGQAAIVVTECVKAQGKAIGDRDLQAYNPRRVGECLIETGLFLTVNRLQVLLLLAVSGGYTGAGERRGLPTATPTAPAPAVASPGSPAPR